MYSFDQLQTDILEKITHKTEDFQRLFHGRGDCFEGWEFLTIDSIDKVLSIAYYSEISTEKEHALQTLFADINTTAYYEAIVLQRRYLSGAPSEVVFGTVPDTLYALEKGLYYKLNILNNQNSGFFADMALGRAFVREHANNKKVLNLFSYTCAFSVAALKGGALSVVNVDMSKRVLETGRNNHRFNGLGIKGTVQYMPYNILKSWSRIKKAGPYDLIIIDPPSFQKGSFAATKDYQKIIRRLDELASSECTVLSALNSPALNTQFIKDLFALEAPSFSFVKRLDNLESFPSADSERSLKNLVFKNTKAAI